jgi:dTDP-L-rhamnose 4-epimerase
MHVLVTGGAGFIGSAIVDLLVARGHRVRVVDNLHPVAHRARPDYVNPDAEYSWADLRDPEVARAAVRGIDAVSHQAAMVGLGVDFADVVDYVGHNDLATAQLLGALHECRFDGRLVLASSMVVYGEGAYSCSDHGAVRPAPRLHEHLERGNYEPPCPHCGAALVAEPVDEHAHTDPRNVYAATKLAQEHLVAAYAREHRAPWVGLRYHNIYGPRMPRDTPYAGVASIFRSAAEDSRAPQVFEDGGQRRDFVHVTDVARANLAALTADPSVQGPYNIATGIPRTVLDLARALTDAIPGAPAPQVVGGHRAGDVRHVFASPRRAQEMLGFETTIPFERGIAEFATDPLRG